MARIIVTHSKCISLFRLSDDYGFRQLIYCWFCTSSYSNSLFIKFLNDYLEKKNYRATAGANKVLIRAIFYYKGHTQNLFGVGVAHSGPGLCKNGAADIFIVFGESLECHRWGMQMQVCTWYTLHHWSSAQQRIHDLKKKKNTHFSSTKHPQRGISGPSTKQHTHLVSYELLFTKSKKKKKKVYIYRECCAT